MAALAERLGELARRAAADPVLLHELNEACSDGVALTTKQGGREICTECEGRASSSSSSSDCAVDFLGLGDCNLDGGALLAELGALPPLTELPRGSWNQGIQRDNSDRESCKHSSHQLEKVVLSASNLEGFRTSLRYPKSVPSP